MTLELDHLIVGCNPLLGVDHFLRERGREKAARRDDERIANTFRRAFEAGARGFNFPTSRTGYSLLGILGNCGYQDEIGLYPMVPDTQTYVSSQLSKGTLGMITEALSTLSWSGRARTVFQGGLSLLTQDPIHVIRALLDVEIGKLLSALPPNTKLKAVLAHEQVTDVALALGATDIFRVYIDHMAKHYDAWPGFVTRNFSRLIDFFKNSELPTDKIVVMTPFNKLGFQMAPSREACEQTLAGLFGSNVIAMSVLAGGQLSLGEAIEYLTTMTNLRSVVVGTSTSGHAEETFKQMSTSLNFAS